MKPTRCAPWLRRAGALAGAALLGWAVTAVSAHPAAASPLGATAALPAPPSPRPGAILLSAAPTPRTVSVVVVPSLEGIRFTLDGISGITGPGGTATVTDPHLSGAAARLVLPQQQLGANLRVRLDRVATDPNHGAFSRRLVAELDEDRAVTIHLLTAQNLPVPLSQVSTVTLTNSLGRHLVLPASQLAAPVWLAASQPARVTNGVTGRLVTYSVDSVLIHGDNVVNIGQLRFNPRQSPVWSVPGIFRTLTVQANDLLTGAKAGGSARLTYRDGTVRTWPFGPKHLVKITNLPRGPYRLQVSGGMLSLTSTVQLSRDQTATQVIVTWGDIVLLGAIGLSITAILVAAGVLGRRRRRTTRRQGATGALLA